MNITFHGTVLADVVAELKDFLVDVGASQDAQLAAEDDPKTPTGASDAAPTGRRKRKAPASSASTMGSNAEASDEKPKRTRRKKADPTEAPSTSTEPKTSRRRGSKTETTSPSEEPAKRTRKRKFAGGPTAADLTKAAGHLAEAESPDAVSDVLEQFGADSINDVSEADYQEFIDMCMAPSEEAGDD